MKIKKPQAPKSIILVVFSNLTFYFFLDAELGGVQKITQKAGTFTRLPIKLNPSTIHKVVPIKKGVLSAYNELLE